jgi:hypothetical protein
MAKFIDGKEAKKIIFVPKSISKWHDTMSGYQGIDV